MRVTSLLLHRIASRTCITLPITPLWCWQCSWSIEYKNDLTERPQEAIFYQSKESRALRRVALVWSNVRTGTHRISIGYSFLSHFHRTSYKSFFILHYHSNMRWWKEVKTKSRQLRSPIINIWVWWRQMSGRAIYKVNRSQSNQLLK